ncbi:MFS transporter [Nocardioides sp. HDW12B]|nr:MFS transporter [Nocardioides sp. HDW12B]
MDVTPLRTSRDFRLLFAAGTVFYFGAMVTYVAIPYQLYTLTGSNAAVGLLGMVELVPILVGGLYGGALADHVDRKRLLVSTGLVQAVATAALAVNAASADTAVWPLYALGFVLATTSALQRPSREALLPRTVPHEQILAANALGSMGMQIGLFTGPALGGVLIATAGPAWCYAVDAAGLLVASAMFAAMRPYPHRDETTAPSWSGIVDSVRYAVSRRDLLGTYLVDIAAMLLAIPVVLFPALAEDVFERPELLGLLYTAETLGAAVATLTSGWAARVHHHGRAIVVAAAAYGGCIALAGLAPSIWVAMLFLAFAGGADMVSALFRGTVWNQTIPESMRGRMAGIEMLSYSLGPLGGQVRAGLVADAWSVRGSIVSGGLGCVVGVAATAAYLRDFWSYDERTDPHAVAERERRASHGPG